MQTIPVGNGLQTIVDDEDYEDLSQWKWYAIPHHSGGFYAFANIREDGKPPRSPGTYGTYIPIKKVAMHRLIMGFPADQVDHINGNKLDNQRHNLRTANGSQNCANNPGRKHRQRSRYKGVYRAYGSWYAQITVNRVTQSLGGFDTEEAAAQAYNEAAIEAWGPYARLNELAMLEPLNAREEVLF